MYFTQASLLTFRVSHRKFVIGMASAIYFLDHAGKPLLYRDFRNDLPLSSIDDFPALRNQHSTPCFTKNGINYCYIEHSNIYVLALSKTNINITSIFIFLNRLVDALKHFVKTVEEESVRDNFVILYELLDEMMDFGHVQNTDINLLQDYVTQSSYQLEVSQALTALTSSISWRPPGIYYKVNELFVDVIETVSALVAPDRVITSSVSGRIALKAYLSGMPLLKLGINDYWKSGLVNQENVAKYRLSKYVKLEDLAFHQCVDLAEFEKDRTIQFVPPDGDFDLITYRAPLKGGKVPFDVKTTVEIKGNSRAIVKCQVDTLFKKRYTCNHLELAIPVPPDSDSPKFRCTSGKVVYAPEKNAVLWRLKDIQGGQSHTLDAQVLLPAVGTIQEPTAPVQMTFEIPALAASGLEIRFLKVTESQLKYNSYPWVKYVTKNGDYEVRLIR